MKCTKNTPNSLRIEYCGVIVYLILLLCHSQSKINDVICT